MTITATAQPLPYLDESLPMEQRIEDALGRMTLREKVSMLHAQSKFSSPGVPRLGIPEFWSSDGPHGIRPEVMWDEWKAAGWSNDSCTAFPALTCLAATWSPDMALLYGHSIGEEARYRRKDILLGPGVNILRTPLCGRNFEYMGEDPYLTSRLCVPYIRGVQDNGVAACVKHFAVNNHEVNRHTTNVVVDERALHELYLPAFHAAVTEGGVWSLMGAYNLYQGVHNSHNKALLVDLLRGRWHFDGVVVSDWGGTHDTKEAIHNGLDLEMGSWTNGMTEGVSNAYDLYYLGQPYLRLLEAGAEDVATLDDKVRHLLRLAMRTTMNRQRPLGSLCSEAHAAAARAIAEEGIVLLKNEGDLLPLTGVRKLLVVGENAVKQLTLGGGSSSLKAQHEVSPLDGLRARLKDVEISYARGYVGTVDAEQDGVRSTQDLRDDRDASSLIAEATELARRADAVVFVGGLNKTGRQDCEGDDRRSLSLPYGQDALIEALAAANKRLVVVNISGNPVAMPWVARVPAIVQSWYLGSEAGTALAAILSGDVCPSGKLPMTFPVTLADVGAHSVGDYPGTERGDGSHIVDCSYREGLFVGYRWAESKKVKPLFAFGHGLSYTQFSYSKPTVDRASFDGQGSVTVSVRVTNTGTRAGAEVVQLYVSDPKSTVARPVKELKGFRKVRLAPGSSADVRFEIDRRSLAFYDAGRGLWVAEAGDFVAHVGAASDDLRGAVKLKLTDTVSFEE